MGQRDARLGADRRRQRTGAGRRQVEVTRAEYTSSNGELRIEATSTSATATLTAFVAYSGERIGTLANLGGGKYGGRFTWSVNPSRVTVKSSLGGSATKVQEK